MNRATTKMTVAFRAIKPRPSPTIVPGEAATNCRSSNIPTEMKKRLENRSRNGTISAMTSWLNSDSETIRPARNAPSA